MSELDKKIIELYQQGVTVANLIIRFGNIGICKILRDNGIEPNQRAKRLYSPLRRCSEPNRGV